MAAKIKTFTKANVKALHQEANEALKKIAAKYGLSLKGGNGTYSESTFGIRPEFFIPTAEGGSLVPAKLVDAFKNYATMYGLKPSDLGKKFLASGCEYQVAGLNTRKPKNAIVLINLSKNCLASCTVEMVKGRIK